MASTIYFNGRVTAIPGSYSEIDASGLAVLGLGVLGVVACIGEAQGGEPNTVIAISNPAKVARTFMDGDLLEAGQILFDPSKDPQIPGGAAEVRFVKVNPATQSTRTFTNGDGNALVVTSKDYGAFTTQINLVIEDGTNQGKSITVTYGDTVEVFDDIGGDPALTAVYTPGANGATTMLMDLDPTIGVSAAFTLAKAGLSSDYPGTTTTYAGKLTDKLADIVATHAVHVVSSSASDTTQTATVIGVLGGVPQVEVLTLNGTTPVVGSATWTTVHGVFLSAVAVGTVTLKDVTGPVSLYAITIGSTTTGGGCHTFTANVLEVDKDTIDFVADAASTTQIVALGQNTVPATVLEAVTLNGTTPVTSSTTWSTIRALALGYLSASRTITLAGLILNETDTVTVLSSNVADTTQIATVYGLSSLGAAQSETIQLNGTSGVAGVATWSQILGIELSAAAAGTVTLRASSQNVLLFSLTAADRYGGMYPVANLAIAETTVSVTSSAGTTRSALLLGLDEDGNEAAEKVTIDGAPHTTTGSWSEITGLVVGHVEPGRTVTVSGAAISLPVGTYTTVQAVSDRIAALSGWVTTLGDGAGPLQIVDMDTVEDDSALTPGSVFSGDLAYIVERLNDESQLVSAASATGASGAPSNTSAATYLTGGIEGTTLFSHWQAAIDLLREQFVNTIVVLTDDEAVHAAVVAHCVYMAGQGRRERDCVLGAPSGTTLTEAKAAAVALNTRHARLLIQDVERFNTDGEREQFPPPFSACVIAGMQSGASIGLPLTFKYANVLDVIGDDATYKVFDDAQELIQAGLCVFEKVAGVGFRVLRNVTTYLIDDNLAYTEASVNQAVNFAIYELRTALEAAVGQKAFAGTANAALGICVTKLGQLMDSGAIVNWRALTIEITADVMDVDVEIAPVLPVNFVRTRAHLVTASFSAAA